MGEITKLASPLLRAESKNASSDAAISRILFLPNSESTKKEEKKRKTVYVLSPPKFPLTFQKTQL
jgi:hypothetical protein